MTVRRNHWGGDARLWPVLLLLFVTVLAPTAGVLWFMAVAVRNERLAVREKFAELYRGHLSQAQTALAEFTRRLDRAADELPTDPTAAFGRSLVAEAADATLVLDERGEPAYPGRRSTAAIPPLLPDDWDAAERQEHDEGDYALAAVSYAALARLAESPELEARALRAQIRCLLRAGQQVRAAAIAVGRLAEASCTAASDEFGRIIAADAELGLIEQLPTGDDRRGQLVERLRGRAIDYTNSAMPSAQRRFVLRRLAELAGESEPPQLAAEELAAAVAEARPPGPSRSTLAPTPAGDVWQYESPDSRIVWLFRGDRLRAELERLIASAHLPNDVHVALVSPGESAHQAFVSLPAGEALPGWQLALNLKNERDLDVAARQGVVLYVWTGVVMVAVVAALALTVASVLGRQLRMARLKNDLVATVSHELKTPLAAMRLLVDTLLDAPAFAPGQVRDYLQLVAQENSRLTRLMDNFLAFSRMARNKWTFLPTAVAADDAIATVTAALAERLQAPGCHFELDGGGDLPAVLVDPDALTTALVNLLDNALKYTGPDKQIALRAYARDGRVCFAVCDNGIGLSPREARRIFEPFYQVDRRLSRTAGGCGLGLAIVKLIADAHGGTLNVASHCGAGSTFTLTLPAADGAAVNQLIARDRELQIGH